MEILLGINTSPKINWLKNIERLGKLDIDKVGLFPTYLEIKERYKLYESMERAGIKSVPMVHLRHDLEIEEIEYLMGKFSTKAFNIHEIPELTKKLSNLDDETRQKIFIENGDFVEPSYFNFVKKFGGVCLDLTHFVDHWVIQKEKTYERFAKELDKQKIGIAHLSALSDELFEQSDGWKVHERHRFDELGQLDYIKDHKDLLRRSEVVVLELENTIDEQIEARKRIENLIR